MNKKLNFRTAAITAYRVLNLVVIFAMTFSAPLQVVAASIDWEETAPPEESEPVSPEVLEPVQPEWTEPDPPDSPPGGTVIISVRDGISSDGVDVDYIEGDPVSVEIFGPVSDAYPGGYNPVCVEGIWDLAQGIWTCNVYLSSETAVDEFGTTYYIAEGEYTYDVYQNDIYKESGSFVDGPPKVEQIWQCDPPSDWRDWDPPYTCEGGWTTGNNDGPIAEGEVVPYRTRFQNLIEGQIYSITIEWDTTKASKHALDYIASFNQTFPEADPCADLTKLPDELCEGTPATIAIPEDTVMTSHPDWMGNQDFGEFTLYGGYDLSLSDYEVYDSSTKDPVTDYIGDTSTSISVTFTAEGTDAVLAWGGHIAERADWGEDNSAVYISGSPYHMRLIRFSTTDETLNVGNMDLSLSAQAVIYPATITIIKDAIPDDATAFWFTDNLPDPFPLSFSLIDDGVGTDEDYKEVFNPIMAFGPYYFTETVPPGWDLTDITCIQEFGTSDFSVDLSSFTANIDLQEGDIFTCTFTNELQTGNIIVAKETYPDGSEVDFEFDPTWGENFFLSDGESLDSGDLLADTYSVAEIVPVGWDLTDVTCVSSIDDTETAGNLELDPGETITCTFTNKKLSIDIDKTGDEKSKVGDPVDYMITVTNTSYEGTQALECDITDSLIATFDETVTLFPGESQSYYPSYTVQEGDPDPLVNTASVACTFVSDTVVQASDSDGHSVQLFQPGVDVEKTGTEISKVGDVAYYTITVTNTGSPDSPDLENGTIVDTLLGDLLDAENPYVISNTCATTLPTGSNCEIYAGREVQEGDANPLLNTVTVHYNPIGFPNDITDSDSHEVDLVYPSIDVEKTGSPYSKTGDTITWTITIKNTGDVPLVLDTLTDLGATYTVPEACEELAADDEAVGGLDECSFEATHVVTEAEGLLEEYVNTVSVLYVLPEMYGLDNEITDQDSFTTDIVHPSFTIEKVGDAFSKYDTLADVPFGDVIDYTLTLVNTGDVDLVLGDLDDTLEPTVALSEECATLSVGETCIFNYTHTVTETEGIEDELSNTAEVSYELPELYALDNIITESDSWTTTLLHPDFEVTKECADDGLMIGDMATFAITFSNLGDANLVFEADEDLYDEGSMTTIVAGTPIEVAVGETLVFKVEKEYDPEPGDPLAVVSNTVTVTVTLAAEYNLDNEWMDNATGVCEYDYWAFTPGFWKNHTSSSPSGNNAWQYTAYETTDLLTDVGFVLGEIGGEMPKGINKTFNELNLLEALRLKGGAGIVGAGEILLRAGVASMLNASFHEVMHPDMALIYFPMTSAEVIDAVNAAIATGDPVQMLELAAELDGYNNGYEYIDWSWIAP